MHIMITVIICNNVWVCCVWMWCNADRKLTIHRIFICIPNANVGYSGGGCCDCDCVSAWWRKAWKTMLGKNLCPHTYINIYRQTWRKEKKYIFNSAWCCQWRWVERTFDRSACTYTRAVTEVGQSIKLCLCVYICIPTHTYVCI